MIEQILQQHFGIQAGRVLKVGQYEGYEKREDLYLLIPIVTMEPDALLELEKLANHLAENGDQGVCQFLKTKENKGIVTWENKHFCILTKKMNESRPTKRFGRKLAKFHYRGRTVPFKVQHISRIGMWKSFWEQRLDQMERVWNEQLFHPPENDFERMFLEGFPYYMGLAENAIQYIMDTELDDEPQFVDTGTVCHERFCSSTWGKNASLKNPFDWVFDHASRDLAEWSRARYLQNIKTYEPDVQKFFKEYTSIIPLSSFSWRLLYARLLFPLHFFECVEEYYITSSEQQRFILAERLKKINEQTSEYEQFLRGFFSLVEVPVRTYRIPLVDWLHQRSSI